MRVVKPRLLCILLASAAAHTIAAHPAPFSYLDLHLDADATRGVLVVHDFDAAHELGIEEPQTLLDPAIAAATADRLVAIIADRLHLALDGRDASPRWGGVEVLREQ